MRRWTGKISSLTQLKTFGCEAYVYRDSLDRNNGDKLNRVAEGGRGRYRYMFPAQGIGYSGKGAVIVDTKHGTASVQRNFDLDENMDHVRDLPLPGACYPHTKEASTSREGMTQEERDEPLEPMDNEEEPMKEATPAQDAGDRSPRKGAPKGLSKGWDMEQPLRVRQLNPKTKNSKSHARYDRYKSATTVGEYLDLAGQRGRKDLRHDFSKGYVSFEGKKPPFAVAGLQPRLFAGLSESNNHAESHHHGYESLDQTYTDQEAFALRVEMKEVNSVCHDAFEASMPDKCDKTNYLARQFAMYAVGGGGDLLLQAEGEGEGEEGFFVVLRFQFLVVFGVWRQFSGPGTF